MGFCRSCGKESIIISDKIGFCASCLRDYWDEIEKEVLSIHIKTRELFNLPIVPPHEENGIICSFCFHNCRIPEGEYGFCGVWCNDNGKLKGISHTSAYVSWYIDPLPTNCVASFICPAATGAGYPAFAYHPSVEKGYNNLAIFYEACNFNCLYCQNWHFRLKSISNLKSHFSEIFALLDNKVSCICYFGGDPGPQSLHALYLSRRALKLDKKILRICWETNGAEATPIVREMMKLSLVSGGCLKIDLKAWSEPIHQTLCGVSNKQTLYNFSFLAHLAKSRPYPYPLVASTLLVPGYVDEEEIHQLAKFLSNIDSQIPWSFLVFAPAFYLDDLPCTSESHVKLALEIAKSYGLNNLYVGNKHLISKDY